MPSIGPMELIVVLVIALVVLGPKKLPDVGRSVGKGVREFKEGIAGHHDEPAVVATSADPATTTDRSYADA